MKKSYFLLHLAVALLGLSGVFGKLISLNEGLMTWYRLLLSAILLFIVLKVRNKNTRIGLRAKLAMGGVGVLVAFSWLFFYASIKYANISIGVVCSCLASFFTALFSPWINKRKVKASEFLWSILSVLGVALIFGFDTTYRVGILLGIISPIFMSLYAIYSAQLVKRYDSQVINFYQMMGGGMIWGMLMPFYLYLFPTEHMVPGGRDIFYLMLLAFFCTVFVYVYLAEVLKRISVFTVNLTMSLEPIYAVLLAFLFFDERKMLNTSFYVGWFLVTVSVVLQTWYAMREGGKL